MSKLIVVVGATGDLGGSVVKSFLADPEYRIRGITCHPDSERARALTLQGVEMVEANIGDESSVDKAFQGADAIFAITENYESFFPQDTDVTTETEFQQGCNLARAASRVLTLRKYLWSTITFNGHLRKGQASVPHFEHKERVDQYIKDSLPDLLLNTVFCSFLMFPDDVLMYPIFKPISLESTNNWIKVGHIPPGASFHSLADHEVNSGTFVHAIVINETLNAGSYVTCIVESLTLESALEVWDNIIERAPEPGLTDIVAFSLKQYVQLWGEREQDQSGQWTIFEYVQAKGYASLPASAEGLGIISDEEPSALERTEASWARIRERL